MRIDKTFIIFVLIILFVLVITLISYSELQYVFTYTDFIIESHVTNLLLLDNLEIQINNVDMEVLHIYNDENLSQKDFDNIYQRMDDAKIELYQILESNTSLNQEFVNKFTVLTDNLFSNILLLDDNVNEKPSSNITLLSDINNYTDSIHILLESEFKNEK